MTALLLCATMLAASPAATKTVEGVKVPGTLEVGGTELTLNGVGVLRATIFNVKVYVVSLY